MPPGARNDHAFIASGARAESWIESLSFEHWEA
jgi:hypothetical protein